MPFLSRLLFFLIALGITWYFNSEKARYNKLAEKAYENKDERAVGKYNEKVNFYSNALGLMFFVILSLFIYLLSGEL